VIGIGLLPPARFLSSLFLFSPVWERFRSFFSPLLLPPLIIPYYRTLMPLEGRDRGFIALLRELEESLTSPRCDDERIGLWMDTLAERTTSVASVSASNSCSTCL
jgi:hypothetical protein